MQDCELAEEGDEGALAEGVCDAGVEGEGGVFEGEEFDPGCLFNSPISALFFMHIACKFEEVLRCMEMM